MSSTGREEPVSPGFYHAVALDYDGTLVEGDEAGPEVLEALASARGSGRKVVLVTGRILAELRRVFPDVDTRVDLIVAENGAVISVGGRERLVSAPVPAALDTELQARNVPFLRGESLLACNGADEPEIVAAIRHLGLECQLTSNRGHLMVLPAGVTKGTGLFEGLAYLGVSHHNTIAVGDAENDHSLLDGVELGVAVANAVESLKAHADLVLERPDGSGIVDLLTGPVVSGHQRVHSPRWRVALGSAPDGRPASVPASQINLLVTGPPRRGKSYVAGLLAEKLIRLRYSVLVLDPEGDHTALGRMRGVMAVGGRSRLPAPADLGRLIAHRFSSVVVDLSDLGSEERTAYLRSVPAAIETQRAETGLPHWVVLDEAQEVFGRDSPVLALLDPTTTGYCLVTHLPDELCPEALLGIDALIAVTGDDPEKVAGLISATGAIPRPAARRLAESAGAGWAVLVERTGGATVFEIAGRDTRHLRHWHKYSAGKLSWERRFHFRRSREALTGTTAANVEDLERELRTCPDEVVRHHSQNGDFSRWVADVLGDSVLAADVAAVEEDLRDGDGAVAHARERLIAAIESRYPG